MVLFKPELMYRFVIERFEGTSSAIQEQALSWLQVLNYLTYTTIYNYMRIYIYNI